MNRTSTDQSSVGFSFQAASSADLNGRGNQLVAGVAYDRNTVDFAASTELGALDETRLAVPGGFFAR